MCNLSASEHGVGWSRRLLFFLWLWLFTGMHFSWLLNVCTKFLNASSFLGLFLWLHALVLSDVHLFVTLEQKAWPQLQIHTHCARSYSAQGRCKLMRVFAWIGLSPSPPLTPHDTTRSDSF